MEEKASQVLHPQLQQYVYTNVRTSKIVLRASITTQQTVAGVPFDSHNHGGAGCTDLHAIHR